MIALRIIAHYQGQSPYASWPSLIVQCTYDHHSIDRLLTKTKRLKELLRELPNSHEWVKLLGESPLGIAPTAQSWLGSWLGAIQNRSGGLILTEPEWINQDKLRLDYFEPNIKLASSWLSWSMAVWNWAVGAEDPRVRSTLVSRAPRSADKLKPSFKAMADALVRLDRHWQYELFPEAMLAVGVGQQRTRITQKVTDRTSGWGMRMAKDKYMSKLLLAHNGLPIAPGGTFHELNHQAIATIEELGYPLVTKPASADQGNGVITQIVDRESLSKSFDRSASFGKPVIVERQIDGNDYRFYLVHGRLLAALERIPGSVLGDGRKSVRQLVTALNQQRRNELLTVEGKRKMRYRAIDWDEEAETLLRLQGLTAESILEAGKLARLRFSANFSVGGSVRECLREVHPANIKLVEKVARLFNLDIAGIDVIATSISQPILGNGGVICEVNGQPGVLPHMIAEPQRHLMEETARMIAPDPNNEPPILAVLGENNSSLLEILERQLTQTHPGLMVVDRHGLRQGEVCWSTSDGTRISAQLRALRDPTADAYLVEINTRSMFNDGLPWNHTDVLVLLEKATNGLPHTWSEWLLSKARAIVCTSNTLRQLREQGTSQSIINRIQVADDSGLQAAAVQSELDRLYKSHDDISSEVPIA